LRVKWEIKIDEITITTNIKGRTVVSPNPKKK